MKQTAVTMVHAKTIDVNVMQDMTIQITQIAQVSCIENQPLPFQNVMQCHSRVIEG